MAPICAFVEMPMVRQIGESTPMQDDSSEMSVGLFDKVLKRGHVEGYDAIGQSKKLLVNQWIRGGIKVPSPAPFSRILRA